jgi:hypothetical protein
MSMDDDEVSYWRHVSVDDSNIMVAFQGELFGSCQAKDARPNDDDLAIVFHN